MSKLIFESDKTKKKVPSDESGSDEEKSKKPIKPETKAKPGKKASAAKDKGSSDEEDSDEDSSSDEEEGKPKEKAEESDSDSDSDDESEEEAPKKSKVCKHPIYIYCSKIFGGKLCIHNLHTYVHYLVYLMAQITNHVSVHV